MAHTFQAGELVLFHEPDFLTTIATFISMDEGWPLIQFSDHTPSTPSQATCRPSRVLPIDDLALVIVQAEYGKAIARGERWRCEVLASLLEEVSAILALKSSHTPAVVLTSVQP